MKKYRQIVVILFCLTQIITGMENSKVPLSYTRKQQKKESDHIKSLRKEEKAIIKRLNGTIAEECLNGFIKAFDGSRQLIEGRNLPDNQTVLKLAEQSYNGLVMLSKQKNLDQSNKRAVMQRVEIVHNIYLTAYRICNNYSIQYVTDQTLLLFIKKDKKQNSSDEINKEESKSRPQSPETPHRQLQ